MTLSPAGKVKFGEGSIWKVVLWERSARFAQSVPKRAPCQGVCVEKMARPSKILRTCVDQKEVMRIGIGVASVL
jgi:hypothetical protein